MATCFFCCRINEKLSKNKIKMEAQSNESGVFLNPIEIIKQLGVENGSVVADFGCASGYFSLPLAQIIGEEGKLFALDILPQALETIEGGAKNLGLSNIETKRVNLEKEKGSGLENASLDWVVLKDVLFQNQDKEVILGEAFRVLKKGGKIILVEWNDGNFSIGPAQNLRIPVEKAKNMVEKEGFSVVKEVEAGQFHYAFVAIK